MAKYRKISPRIWNDAKVRELTDKGKLAFLFMLTHPTMTPFGAIRANVPGLAFELGWTPRAFSKAMQELCANGMAAFEEKANLIWFPNFLKYNRPENPNVIKSWVGAFEDLPECALRDAIYKALLRLSENLSIFGATHFVPHIVVQNPLSQNVGDNLFDRHLIAWNGSCVEIGSFAPGFPLH